MPCAAATKILDAGDVELAQPLDFKRLLATGTQLTETGRSQARQLGSDLIAQGRVAAEQISDVVDDLVSRNNRDQLEEVRQTVRAVVDQQLSALAAALKRDFAKSQ